MVIGVLREPTFENRVSMTPESVAVLVKKNCTVWVEEGAGKAAFFYDQDYEQAGAVIKNKEEILQQATILLAIHPPNLTAAKTGVIAIGMYQPLYKAEQMKQWANDGHTIFSLDMLPRTTRAQSMDVLSSQANIAGYKAVLKAASMYSRYFPMLMTAAGSIPPAKVLILGAGVAGLQAIATARRLGAVVEVFDTRPAVKEEVMSLGAKFIEVAGAADATMAGGYAVEQSEDFKQRQQQRITESCAKADILITTAQIPGKPAPVLITEPMLLQMKQGTVIIDLAAATGGNTPFTKNNETIVWNGITIVGNSSLAAEMPSDASKLYGKNLLNFLQLLINKEQQLYIPFEDDLVKGCCMAHDGALMHERLK